MIIHFPQMHAELTGRPLLPGERLIDPGLAPEAASGEGKADYFRPSDLPIDSRTLTRMVRDFLAFGEQFRDLHDLADLKGKEDESRTKVGSESDRAIRADLDRRLGASREAAPQASGTDDADLRKAQLLLALAWTLEERLVESMGVEQGLTEAMERFSSGLGLEMDEADPEVVRLGKVASSQEVPVLDDQPLPWRKVLGAALRFVPPDSVLAVSDPEVLATFEDLGLVFSAPAPGSFPEGVLVAEARAGDLARAGRDAGSWADKTVFVARVS